MSGPYSLHDNCGSFECRTCGNKVLLSCSCHDCFEGADYEEVMDAHPEDDLCKGCHEKQRKVDRKDREGDARRDAAKDDKLTGDR